MEKVRPKCGQPSDRGRLEIRSGRKLLVAVTRELRYGPSRLRVNDDDDDDE